MILEIPTNIAQLITIGLKCPKCGNTWGIRMDKLENNKIPVSRFVCERCTTDKIEQEIEDERKTNWNGTQN